MKALDLFQNEGAPISFPKWNAVLWEEEPGKARGYTRVIVEFLRTCRKEHVPASVDAAKRFLASLDPGVAEFAREALRWFVREAKRRGCIGFSPVNSGRGDSGAFHGGEETRP